MSVGNLKDQGNKGNNFPYQLSVLKLLGGILEASGGVVTPVTRTTSLIRVSEAGSVAAGARSVSFLNSGLVDVTVLGTVLKVDEQVTFAAGLNDVLGEIAYDASAEGAQLLISKIV